MRKVLLAYDGSPGAKLALEELKRNRPGFPADAEVLVLCVADVWSASALPTFGAYGWADGPLTDAQLQALQTAERLELKKARRIALEACKALQAERPGWDVRAESCADAPAWGLIKRAEEWGAEVIILGSHGRSALGRIVLGSVSHAVVREAPCAVRVVRGRIGKRDASACLIIGFDGSRDAEAAVEAVAQRFWPAGSAARLVTAIDGRLSTAVPFPRRIEARRPLEPTWMHRMIPRPNTVPPHGTARPLGRAPAIGGALGRGMMEDPVQRLRAAGLSVTTVVRRGDPSKLLVEAVRRWDADSLFVGARGLRGIQRFLLGSVSTAVAMQASCPVEVVRPARTRADQEPVRQQVQTQRALVSGT